MSINTSAARHDDWDETGLTIEPSPLIDVADLLIAYLEQIGIEYIFGVPGGAIEPLYNAIARSGRRGGIRHIVARHESGAAFMADGYARETGKIGVCCATSGPGATNLITGVANSFDNNIPLLVITGQSALPAFGKHALQESACTGVNVPGMFQYCTRYNSFVSHPKQLEAKLVTALQRAARPPRGPVHLALPVDVSRSPSPVAKPSYDLRNFLASSSLVDEAAVEVLSTLLDNARKVVVFIGGLCGEAVSAILQFVALKGAAFVATPDGKGLVSSHHPLFRGVFGFSGHMSADAALRDPAVDLILAVGASMGEWNSGGWSESVLNERLVHIDESEDNFALTPMARFHVRGRILTIFNRLVARMRDTQECAAYEEAHRRTAHRLSQCASDPDSMLSNMDKYLSEAVPIKPQRLMRELGRLFPPTTHFLADAGNSMSWATHYLHPMDRRAGERRLDGLERNNSLGRRRTPGGWLRVTANFAPMGWAIGGAVGTAVANPHVPVVCITGDGSLLMNGQEISVAVAEGLTVIFVVLNDSALGMVKHGQRLANAEQIGYELPPTDFVALARAMGADGYAIRSPEDLSKLDVDAICSRKGPTLLDVQIDPDEIPPMNVRMKILAGTN